MEDVEHWIPLWEPLSLPISITIEANQPFCKEQFNYFVAFLGKNYQRRLLVASAYKRDYVEMRNHLETHAAWTRAPVATKSRLSLWPHVSADTGH